MKKYLSTEYLLSALAAGFAIGSHFLGKTTAQDVSFALGIVGAAFMISRVIHKRGQDMAWTGWKTRELHFFAVQCLWNVFGIYRGILEPKTGLFMIAAASAVYCLCRGFTKGRVIRGNTQILKI